jgi:hypothetical protein
MPYSQALAERIRQVLRQRNDIVEKKMFGGLVWMLNGNILVGVWHLSLIARLGREQATLALQQRHVKPFDVTGTPMTGWIMVEPEGIDLDQDLQTWIELAETFVETLPRK